MFTRLLALLIAWVIAFPAYGMDVNGELKKAVLEKQAADPTGYAGRVYYNTGTNAGKIYNGTSWLTIADSASAVTNPMTTLGDIIIGAASGVVTRLGIGSNLQILRSNGTTLAWTDGLATATESGLVSREIAWTTFAPALVKSSGAGTLGAVTLDHARYSQIGKTVFVSVYYHTINISVGTVALAITLPVTPKNNMYPAAWINNAGTQAIARQSITASSATMVLGAAAAGGAFAIGSSSEVMLTFSYEAL